MPQRAILWDALMSQAPIAVLLADSEGKVVQANPSAVRLLDAERAETLMGKTLPQVFGNGLDGVQPIGEREVIERRRPSGETQYLAVIRSHVDADPIKEMILFRDAAPETTARQELSRAVQELQFQNSLLEAQSDAAVEGILVVDPQGKILSHNRRFVEMWEIPEHAIASRSDEDAVAAVLSSLKDPDQFIQRIQYLYSNPNERSRDLLELRDGRFFSRYSAPVAAGEVVLGRIWFFQDITEQRRNEEALRFAAESASILSETLDARVTLTRIARLAVPRLSDWCVIYRSTSDGDVERVAIEHSDPADTSFARELENFDLDPNATEGVAAVIRSGRSSVVSPVTPEFLASDVMQREEFTEIVRRIGVSAWMCVPLEARGRVLGAMSFIASHSGRTYDEHDVALAEDLGHRAGLAMDNAALFEHQRSIARTLQQSLLPSRLPEIEKLDMAVRYVAAGEGFEVGGDFYDIFPTPDGWGLVIGDVVGKGPNAAALTALARYTIRTAVMQDPSPVAVLRVLNEAILLQHEGSRFCTAMYAELIPAGGEFKVRVARGGHPPPLVMRADGTIEEIAPDGLLLGLFPDAQLQEGTASLGPGDTLMFFTDGVVEARTGSVTLGEEGLKQLVSGFKGFDADRCADEIERGVLDLQQGRPHDDFALVVLRVEGGPRSLSEDMSPSAVAWFESKPDSLRDVRQFVRQHSAKVLSNDSIETAILLADELAANAIRHARTEFRVAVRRVDSVLRIEVRDLSTLHPEMLPFDVESTGGRGLPIVASESQGWGIARRVDGKAIWFELALDREGNRV